MCNSSHTNKQCIKSRVSHVWGSRLLMEHCTYCMGNGSLSFYVFASKRSVFFFQNTVNEYY